MTKILIFIIMSKMCKNVKLQSIFKKERIFTSNYSKAVKLFQSEISCEYKRLKQVSQNKCLVFSKKFIRLFTYLPSLTF